MNKSGDLLELVQSMNTAEKKYFKRFVTRYWGNKDRNSINLFEQLIKAKSYDFKKTEKKTSPAIQKHLPVYRLRLYELILSSLQSFYADTSVDNRIYDLLGKVEVLHNRGFFEAGRKMLKKARKLAQDYEKYDMLISINQWEKRIMQSFLFEGIKEKELHKLAEEEKDYSRRIDEVNDHWKQASVFYLNYRKKGKARTREEKKFYERLADHPLLKKKRKLLSSESEMYKMLTCSRYAIATTSINEFELHSMQTKELMEKAKYLIAKEPFIYCIANYNYLYALMTLKKIKAFYRNLYSFKNIPAILGLKQYRYIQSYITSTSINLELNVIVETGEFDKGIILFKEIEPLMPSLIKVNPLFANFIVTNLSYCYFGEGNFKEALLMQNKVTIDPQENSFYQSHLSKLIIHYELGNTQLLVSLIRSLYRNLLSKQKLHKTETLFIDFLRKNIRQLNTKEQRLRAFAELRDELLKLKDDLLEREFLDVFDLVSWLESKIENRSFKEIIREKAGIQD